MPTEPMDFSDVPLAPERRLDAAEFRGLWVDDYYDGVLAGMVERGGERLYLEIHDRGVLEREEGPWRWVVLRLSPAARVEQERQHMLFAQHVGTHWCTHEFLHPALDGEPSMSHFYEQQATRPQLTRADCEVIGWIDEPPRPERPRAKR